MLRFREFMGTYVEHCHNWLKLPDQNCADGPILKSESHAYSPSLGVEIPIACRTLSRAKPRRPLLLRIERVETGSSLIAAHYFSELRDAENELLSTVRAIFSDFSC